MTEAVLVHRAVQDQPPEDVDSLLAARDPASVGDHNPQTPERFTFRDGRIWSGMGGSGEIPLEPDSAEAQLLDLRRIALNASEAGWWRFVCRRYARQLDTALNQYRAFWKAKLEEVA